MIFILALNLLVLIWSFAKFRKLTLNEKAKAKQRFLASNLLNMVGIAASLLTIMWSAAVTPPVTEFEDPTMYMSPAVLVVGFFVIVYCSSAAVVGIYNIRKYSTRRGLLIF
jgi:uncharacterized membrane protein